MDIEQQVNFIKYWLQRFGDRNNEGFIKTVTVIDTEWTLHLQYSFDENGVQLEPFDWCINSFKHIMNNNISDRIGYELDDIITALKAIKA